MGCSELLSSAKWAQAVEKYLETKDFEVLKYVVQPLGATGGFLGDHYTAEVTVRLHETKNIKKIHFFLKTEPMSSSQSEVTNQINAFKKEVDTLNILFVKLKSVLKDSGKNMIWACKCYYTESGFIVMEDLTKQGFVALSLRDTLKFDHFALTMKALANMHAASIIFEERQPHQPYRLINVHPDIFQESLFRHAPNHPGTRWLNACVKTTWFLVELIRGKEDLCRLKSELEQIILSLYDLQKPSDQFRNVTCQGDVKRDNILFRHENGVPVDVRIVDYQFTRYTPPANDVISFLYLSSDRKFREQYAPQLLSIYYDQFSRNLIEHDLKPEKLLSWEEFKNSYDFYRILGILIAVCYSSVTYIGPETMSKVFSSSEVDRLLFDDREQEVIYSFNNDDFFKSNVTDVIEELIEYIEKSNQQ